MKRSPLFFLWLLLLPFSVFAQKINAPNGKLSAEITHQKTLKIEVFYEGEKVVSLSDPQIALDGKKQVRGKVKPVLGNGTDQFEAAVPLKFSQINQPYTSANFSFNDVQLQLRLYNDGLAYRFKGSRDKVMGVNEGLKIQYPEKSTVWSTNIKDDFASAYEKPYKPHDIKNFSEYEVNFLPMLVTTPQNTQVLLTDTDVLDYPNMFVRKSDAPNTLEICFPKKPKQVVYSGDRRSVVKSTETYIAETNTKRNFPWRIFVIGKDADLLTTTLPYHLGPKPVSDQTDWVKPGQVSWEWWNGWNLYGVDFEAGINTQTYLYYIDFASKNGIPYLLLDEGWSISTTDISKPAQSLDLKKIIAYGKEKKVDLILWASWMTLEKQMEVLPLYRKWGVAGIKVDFMNRADQDMVNFYEEVAKACWDNQLLVDFHGSYKPAGLQRKYPNIVSHEGVLGLEYSKSKTWVTPEHNLRLPFIRMTAGPMDYTPGAMRNFHPTEFCPSNDIRAGGQGTRAHQAAMYVVYESAVNMLCDTPSNYERAQECTDFITQVPTTWDETRVLDAKFGEYVVMARRKGEQWFVGGMCAKGNYSKTFKADFLQNKTAQILKDGINADRWAEDFQFVNNQSLTGELTVEMIENGGFSAIID
ncbi:glycoside hydrolase family 97 protein [Persicobacter diffluens]|uniref:Alpha-glucosidase n=1 Tax=Persicobacter diffluens TaxID=981 RepID=A0AAN4W414_9BACT|nr:alpha-glucosidase [Persicobacter diffluens]